MSLTLQDIYTPNAVTTAPDKTLSEVRRVLDRLHVHHLPVVENGELVSLSAVTAVPLSRDLKAEVPAIKQFTRHGSSSGTVRQETASNHQKHVEQRHPDDYRRPRVRPHLRASYRSYP